MRPRNPTRASEALKIWIPEHGYTQESFAAAIRHDGEKLRQTTVSSWILGHFAPNTVWAVRVAEFTRRDDQEGIPVEWWTMPPLSSADGTGEHSAIPARQAG